MTPSLPQPIDVRTIPPVVRHATIFGLLERLEPGEALGIVNDHNPVPLRGQIEGRYPDLFSWRYILQGPDLWQVEIRRGPATEDAADCGGHEGQPCTCGN